MRSTSAAFCGVLCALLVPIARANPTTVTLTFGESNPFCSGEYLPQMIACYESCVALADLSFTTICPPHSDVVLTAVTRNGDGLSKPHASTTSSGPTTSLDSTTSNSTTALDNTTSNNRPTLTALIDSTPTPKAAISGEVANTTLGSGTGPTGPKPKNHGALAGGVVAGIVFVALLAGAFFFWRRRRQHAASTRDFDSLEKSIVSSPVYPAPITPYNVPSPPPQLYQGPAITPVESHHLMGGYSELSQQHRGGGVVPAVGAAKYAAGNQREVDEDGVSLRSPSPVQDGSRIQEARDSVPRLPIYNRGSEIADRGPAL